MSAVVAPVRVHIRWMIRLDLPEVLEIEERSSDFPWQEKEFLRCLRQRNCIGMVAVVASRVVGFMLYELHKSKLYVLNLAVHPDFRRQGIGSQMVSKLMSKLSQQWRTQICLEVREKSQAALLFLQCLGFLATSVLRGNYEDSGEDAYVMEYRVQSP